MIMSTNRRRNTVWCSYCMSKGHNKQTCEVLKKDIEHLRQSHGDHHPEVKEYDDNRKSVSASASRRAKMPRSCTYCGSHGHNRRTCRILKDHKKIATELNAEYCHRVYETLCDNGIGVGSMIRVEQHGRHLHRGRGTTWPIKQSLWMIVQINWDEINFLEPHRKTIICRSMDNNEEMHICPPMKAPTLDLNSWEVVSPSYSVDPSDDWKDGHSVANKFTEMDQDSVKDLLYDFGKYSE